MNASRVDFSFVVLVLVLTLLGGGIWEMARAFPDAGKGLVIYAREQKDLFVDAGLIEDSYRVRAGTGLAKRLREETVIVATRISAREAYMGAGVILGIRAGRTEILTARHIVGHKGRTFVIFPNRAVLTALRVVTSRDRDLAVVWVRGVWPAAYSPARLANDTFRTGDPFIVMGHPGAKSWTASPGLAERHLYSTFLFCPTCDRGDSGAGAFDRTGLLRGIVVTKAILRAPSSKSGRYFELTAFEIEQPEAIRAFLRTAR